ncbi:MAG: methyl-accepting chemotaxis protein [Candidatus Kapaibacterium sp.]|nr:MAG: methyl-accepting chemotaxis protein [Candidatus Kapabacteria bacterium]
MKKFQDFVLRFVPSEFEADYDMFRRAKLLVSICLITAMTCPIVSISYLLYGHYLAILFLAISTVCFFMLPVLLRTSRNLTLAGHLLCAFSFSMLHSLILTTNGLRSTVFQWTAVIPLFAALTLSKRQMFQWLAVTVVVALGYFIAGQKGVHFMNGVPEQSMLRSEFVALSVLAVVLALVANMFESGRQEAFANLEQRNKEADDLNKGLVSMKSALEREKVKVEEMVAESEELNSYLAGSMEHMLEAVHRFASGDLTVRFHVEKEDDIGKIFLAFNSAIDNMRSTIIRVVENVEATAGASAQISVNTEHISAASREQAQGIMGAASAIEDFATQMQETSKKATEFATNARKTALETQASSGVVNQTIEGMNKIDEVVQRSAATVEDLGVSSNQIGEIIQVIDEIADQTNLLALNAAIEAARAGEQGRGFAVVADEVRKLAERTTKATKEIAAMITKIQRDTQGAVHVIRQGTSEVQKGKGLVGKTGIAIESAMKAAMKSAETYGQIAQTNKTQSSEMSELSEHMNIITGTVRETANGVEQIAEAARSLNALAEHLNSLVGTFRIDNRTILQITAAPKHNKNWREFAAKELD